MSELPLEEVPAAADAVHAAASGRVIHITEGGQRLAAIVPESMLGALHDAEDAEDAAEADAAGVGTDAAGVGTAADVAALDADVPREAPCGAACVSVEAPCDVP